MNKISLILLLFITGLFSASAERSEDIVMEEIVITLPSIEDEKQQAYCDILEQRLLFLLEEKKTPFEKKKIVNQLIFKIPSNTPDINFEKLRKALTKNVRLSFHEVLEASEINTKNAVFVLSGDESFIISKTNSIHFEHTEIEVLSEGFHPQNPPLNISLNKDSNKLADFVSQIMKNGTYGKTKMYMSISGILHAASVLQNKINTSFCITSPTGNSLDRKLVFMQFQYPLPFEIINHDAH